MCRSFTLGRGTATFPRSVLFGILLTSLVAPCLGQAPDVPPGYRAVEVQSVPVAELAPQVQRILREADPNAEVLVDPQRGRILIRGPQNIQQLAQDLVKTLDRPPAPAAPRPEAAAVEPVVRGYPVPAERLAEAARQLQERFGGQPGVRIATDGRTNQLLVVAPAGMQAEIERAIGNPGMAPELALAHAANRPQPNTPSDITLQNLSAEQLEKYLRSIWGSRVTITSDPVAPVAEATITSTNGAVTRLHIDKARRRVHIAAPPALQRSWYQLLSSLDGPAAADQTRHVYPIHQADPGRVGYAVSMLQQAMRTAAAAQPPEAEDADLQPPDQLPLENEQPVDEDEQPEMPEFEPEEGDEPDVPAIARPGTDEAGLALEALDEAGLLGDVRIEFIPELGVIVLIGRERDVQRVQRIIAEIERQSQTLQPQIEIVPLQHLNSQALATLIIELYNDVFAPRQGPLSITSLDKPNALLLIGRLEAMQPVLELIAKLDHDVPPATQLKVFPLRHISAIDAERLVRGFFVNQPGGATAGAPAATGELRPALGTRARVLADYRTNALIVQASPRDLAEVSLFIRSIDKEAPLASHTIRIFRLQNTLAVDLAPILQGAITNSPVTVPGQQAPQVAQQQQQNATQPSTRLTIVGLDTAERRIIESGVLTDVGVTADPNTNALIVRGPEHSMDLIAELIRQLDQAPDAAAQIKVFEIENGDATSLAIMLQQLFGQQVTAGQGQLGQTLRQVFGDLQTASAGGTGESSLIPLRFAVDARTNSIIASGSTGDLEVVEILLLRLDESDVETRKMFVYRLKNAPALDVANSISQFLITQQQIFLQQLQLNQAVSPIEQIDRQVVVVPELVSNSLIVSVTPRYYEQVLQIIEDLDFRPPMVMVQVMICEVLLTDDFEFGVELGLQDSLLFDRGIPGVSSMPGFNFNGAGLPNNSTYGREDLAGQSISTFGLGRSSANLGYGGLVLSAASESISILVRALQDAGRLQVLSRPQVMALDNQVAFVQVGARVPRVTGSTINPQGGTQTQTADVDVGLLLRIQPRINQDGLVVMNIDAENSEVGDIAQGIPVAITDTGQVINSPQINTTTAQTTISAHSGQTVIFAGLITKNRAVRSRRVPFVSDIPVLGRLFRFDAESEERRELLIFMTPYIVKEDADYDWLKYVESQRMSWCLGDVVEMHGDVGLSGGHGLWGPPVAPLIFPDLDPTGCGPMPNGPLVPETLQGQPLPGDPMYGPPLPAEPFPPESLPGSPPDAVPPPGGFGARPRELPWRTWVAPAPEMAGRPPQYPPAPSF